MSDLTGREPQLSGDRGNLSTENAVVMVSDLTLRAAKTLTAITYADALSLAGQNFMRRLGVRVDFSEWSNVEAMRNLVWVGTPYLPLDQFAECAALVSVYNEFDPEHVVQVFESLVATSDQDWLFRLAREYSPAVYVWNRSHRLLDETVVRDLSHELRADATGYGISMSHRFWWD